MALALALPLVASAVSAQEQDEFFAVLERSVRVNLDSTVDAVAHDAPVDGGYGWAFVLENASGSEQATGAAIEVDSGHDPSLFPNFPEGATAFPISTTAESLEPGMWLPWHEALEFSDVPANMAPGFDSARWVAPAFIPDGGGTQTMTITLTLRDEGYTDPTDVTVEVSWFVPDTQVVAGTASPPDVDVHNDGLRWSLTDPPLDQEFVFSVEYHVPNDSGVPLEVLPDVHIHTFRSSDPSAAPEGTSVEILEPALDGGDAGRGRATFSADQARPWRTETREEFHLLYNGLGVPPVDHVPTPPNSDPPAFSRDITSSFPHVAFPVTCTQMNMQSIDPSFEFGGGVASEPHYWYLKTKQAGSLVIDHVGADAVGEDENGGHIIAQLFDHASGELLREVAVPFVLGEVNVLPMAGTPAAAGQLFRLEVRREVVNDPVGSHYELGYVLLDGNNDPIVGGVDVGVNSPALPEWLEGVPQVFHVNVGPGEQLQLRLTPASFSEHDPSSRIRVFANPNLTGLLASEAGTGEPYEVTSRRVPGGGTLTVLVNADHHYMLEKLSGTDTGIYFDACALPEPASVDVSNEAEYRAALASLSEQPHGPHTINIISDFTISDPLGEGDPTFAGSAPLTINGNGHTVNSALSLNDTRFLFHNTLADLTIDGLTVEGFDRDDNGGAVLAWPAHNSRWWESGPVNIQDSTFTGNRGRHGGAIAAHNGVTVSDSVLSGNTAGWSGGAISTLGRVTVSNIVLSGNTAGSFGGAIASSQSAVVTVSDSLLSDNTAGRDGGAVYGGSAFGHVSITNSTVSGNTAGRFGGAIASLQVTVTDSVLSGNTADNGGAISIGNFGRYHSAAVVERSTLSGNLATERGGAVYGGSIFGHVSITNGTVSGNAADAGGAIYTGGRTTLAHATVAENAGASSANIFSGAGLTSFGSVIAHPLGTVVNCVIRGPITSSYSYDTHGSCGFSGVGDTSGGPNPLLGPLQDNAGPTWTIMPQSGSPLINAIPVASCHAEVPTDQRGITRPQGAGCDIGAVEVEP